MHDHVWYASYGSNLSAARFGHYLHGGQPAGATRDYPGARDPSPPTDRRALHLAGEVFFGWESPTWGGGVAFLDIEATGDALACGYRITAEQLADVVTQEMHREPGPLLDLDVLLAQRRLVLGDGRYETVLVVGDVDGEPVVTFTCPSDDRRPTINPPSAAYLAVVARGLVESHGLAPDEVVGYLEGLAGVRGRWPSDDLTEVVRIALGG
ncbi:hypothetical protein [Luteipulveratus mongoliensis]|uniref:Histone deacetylase n=1 Tax=Luteipulveratus mongoliensis TaxID=571913 RepID=A0A0K1JHZ2_9MICO|nr:hypothetical protein [Luteipulveratus mongoliensis]AKU16339.1 hypothetical protein VV02_11495 [Luteipulveratus mongoliensis]